MKHAENALYRCWANQQIFWTLFGEITFASKYCWPTLQCCCFVLRDIGLDCVWTCNALVIEEMEQPADAGLFACFNCNLNLTGYRYILRDEKPFCIKCYESLFANSCEDCRTPIGTDSKVGWRCSRNKAAASSLLHHNALPLLVSVLCCGLWFIRPLSQ